MVEQTETYPEESFGKCPTCGSLLHLDGQDAMSAVDPERVLGDPPERQKLSDPGRYAQRLRCENGHLWWMLREDVRT